MHYLYRSTLGGNVRAKVSYRCDWHAVNVSHPTCRRVNRIVSSQYLQTPFLRSLASYILYRTNSPFDRRVTTLEWHPTRPNTVAVGSKGGDIILWDYEELNNTMIPGVGMAEKCRSGRTVE